MENGSHSRVELIEVKPDAPRPATILHVAGELERRGSRILELFKELQSARGRAVFPIHLQQDGREGFVEVETGPWNRELVAKALERTSVMRHSEHAGAYIRIVSAYPVPPEVVFLTRNSPAALLQLDLVEGDLEDPETFAEIFLQAASRRWDVDLDYSLTSLPLTEELLLAALDGESGGRAPVLEVLVGGLGCFLGEIIRRNAPSMGTWQPGDEGDAHPVIGIEDFVLDPIGKARAFLETGPDDSIAFYANFVLKEIRNSRPADQA